MASKSSTSTLFSSYKSSKIHRNCSKNGTSSSRYIVGSVGKTCGKHIKFGESGSTGSGYNCGNSHQNVAIATQVLNPSAIGGSLKNRRFVEHFGPKEDDEISFLSSRSRAVCSKVCYYGISIGVTVIMITGLIIAIGYMQSEKQRIATRPVKLAQGQDFQSSTTHLPPAILHGTTTTIKPKVTFTPDNGLMEDEDNDDDDMDEISVGDFIHTGPQSGHHHQSGISNFKILSTTSSTNGEAHYNIDNANDDENSISDEDNQDSKPPGSRFGDNKQDQDDGTTSPEDYEDSEHAIEEGDTERPFSEVRVKPPSDYKFEGISFEIPIYRTNANNSINSHPNKNDIIDANSLSEIETENTREVDSSKSTNSNDDMFTTTLSSTEEEETKENFTSLIHSQENNGNNEHEEVLSSDLGDEETQNYANANDFSQTTTTTYKPNNPSLGFNPFLKPTKFDGSNSKSNVNNGDDQIIVTTSSSIFPKTKQPQYDKTNNEDFAIRDETQTAEATLQTDIFDSTEEFQASASEESEIDAESEDDSLIDDNRNTPIVTSTRRPKLNNHHGNTNEGQNDDGTVLKPKAPRRGKILVRPLQSPSPSYHDVDYEESEPSNNGRLKDNNNKKQSQRPIKQKKFHGKVNSGSRHNKQGPGQLKQGIQLNLGGSSGFSSGESLPNTNLDYKVDFSRYIPTTPASVASTEISVDTGYQLPLPQNGSPYPDFRFSPPPIEHHKPFNLEEYLQKHAHKKTTTVEEPTSTPTVNIDFSHLQSYNIHPTAATSYTGPSLNDASSLPFTQLSSQDNSFSPQAPTNNFGGASPTGATLNIFPNYNFDGAGNYQTGNSNFNLPSYNSLPLPAKTNEQHGFTVDANGAFSLINPSSLPYPNIATSQASDNLGNNFQNAYSFTNNNPPSQSKDLILTTGTGQVPTYNTITQGIHLLTLLSGRNSGQGYQNSNNDQLSSGSSTYQTTAELPYPNQPHVQIPGLSGNSFENNWNKNAFQLNSGSTNYPNYGQDFFPRKNFRAFDQSGDQDSSASLAIPSFSQSIIMKASNPSFGGTVQAIQLRESTTEPSNSPPTGATPLSVQPKSLSISILPKSSKLKSPSTFSFQKLVPKPQIMDSSELLESSAPKSRKRLMLPEPDLDVGESGLHIVSTTAPKYDRRRLSGTGVIHDLAHNTGAAIKGLKSGFFS